MLDKNTYFIREHVGFLKLSDTYDILDPETKQQIGIAKEKPGALIHVLRFLINKKILPTQVFVYEGNNPDDESKLVFSIRKGFLSRVKVCDKKGDVIGQLRTKLLSIGGAFAVLNTAGEQVATVKGDWKGWNFRFLSKEGNEIGTITKKWAGLGKELFTSADNYIVSIKEANSPKNMMLLLAASLAVDTVFYEN